MMFDVSHFLKFIYRKKSKTEKFNHPFYSFKPQLNLILAFTSLIKYKLPVIINPSPR